MLLIKHMSLEWQDELPHALSLMEMFVSVLKFQYEMAGGVRRAEISHILVSSTVYYVSLTLSSR